MGTLGIEQRRKDGLGPPDPPGNPLITIVSQFLGHLQKKVTGFRL
jgi:hypothetical protein